MQLWQDIVDLLKQPFVGQLDIEHLFLLVGLVLVFIAAWIIILQHIRVAGLELVE